MNCPNCGSSISDKQGSFCSRCGAKISKPTIITSDNDAKLAGKRRNSKYIGFLLFLSVGISIVAFIGTIINNQLATSQTTQYSPIEIFFGAIVYSLLFTVLLIIKGNMGKCPSCGSFNGAVQDYDQTENLGHRDGYRTKTDTERIRNGDETIGTITRQTQVRVRTTQYRNHHHCKYCNYQWTKDTKSESENFDID